MAVTRQLANGNRLIDWTDEIKNVGSQFGFISNSGLFNLKGTSQDAIQFEKSDYQITLLQERSRRQRDTQKLSPRESDVYSLALPYFKVSDYITREDIQGYVQRGTDMTPETAANIRMDKIEVMRQSYDMTKEYMQLSAVKGLSITPSGRVVANMFDMFGLTQETITWTLSNPDFDVIKACRELKTKLVKSLRTGGTIRAVEVMVGTAFFDALIAHPQVVNVHLQMAKPDRAYYLDGGATYEQFGVSNVFEFQGIRFMTYDATFNVTQADGSVVVQDAIGAGEGHTLIRGVNDLFRGYYGNSNKFSGANQVGSELYLYEWDMPKDEGIEMEMEFSHLYFPTQPQTLKKLVLA